ncbi:hypothetical protein MAIT1_02714 [Magnetofaba australis IT-1]|uniref:Uncharacterized protein n=2 Tax=Magnetofaba TaxID=1472292 RepID=A0A1Y2K3C1_9PROT|nr:hypothetical protein MAIT1_02714 [Magnetofaba australis IT-1]
MLETLLAVCAYWGIAWYWDTHIHLIVSICVAPLLLLRSEESVKLGAKWFVDYWQDTQTIPFKPKPIIYSISVFFSFIVSGFTSCIFYEWLLSDITVQAVKWYALLYGYIIYIISLSSATLSSNIFLGLTMKYQIHLSTHHFLHL